MNDLERIEVAHDMAYIALATRLARTMGMDMAALADELEIMADAQQDAGVTTRLERLAGGLDLMRKPPADAPTPDAPPRG